MSERYQKLSTLLENLYLEGAPLLIAAGALLKDNQDGRVLVQLKLQNLNQSRLVACKVSVWAFDPSGAELEGIADHAYLDLKSERGECFGTQEPIYLPDHTTRSFSVAVTQAVFQNGEVWQSPGGEWRTVTDKRRRPAELFEDPEVQRQYALELWNNCTYVPVQTGSLFLCACGAVNLAKDPTCSKCRRNFSELLKKADLEDLTRKKDARLAREKAEKLERERKAEEERLERERKAEEEKKLRAQQEEERRIAAEKAKKRNKMIATVAAAVVALGTAIAIITTQITTKVIIPGNKYKAAEALLEAGDYDGAIAAFTDLGEYKDAAERIQESYYQKGESFLKEQNYQGAIVAFTQAGKYKDAIQRAEHVPYLKAEDILATENYERAIKEFEALGNYGDAAERANQIKQMQYDKASTLLENGDYNGAVYIFSYLSGFLDSKNRIYEAKYKEAMELLEKRDYDTAITKFQALGNYSDSKEYVTEAKYRKAISLIEAGEYSRALPLLVGFGESYKDSTKFILEAKEGVYQNALLLFKTEEYVQANSLFQSIKDYKDSSKQMEKIIETIYAEAFRSLRAGKYADAAKQFETQAKEYPEFSSTLIADYAVYCKIKAIKFDDGEDHNLAYVYKQISSIKDKSLKDELMKLPQMKTLMTLQGAWEGKYHSFTFQSGYVTFGIVSRVGTDLAIGYYNGHYCFSGVGNSPTHYSEIYNISQNQFSYRDRQNDSYMNVDTLKRVS